jgi:hypothetical protein
MKTQPNHAHRIATEYGGCLPYHEIFYIRSIRFSADRALGAFNRYYEAIKLSAAAERVEEIVFALQEALGHCAAVSRYFSPVSDEELALARAKTLRAAFAFHDDDPLLNVRLIRNAIEHFDERLDCFCSRDPVGAIFDLIVGSEGLADEQVTHVLRLVDPASQIIILFGKKYPFGGLHRSIERIHGIASMMDREGGRLRSSQRKRNGEKTASS